MIGKFANSCNITNVSFEGTILGGMDKGTTSSWGGIIGTIENPGSRSINISGVTGNVTFKTLDESNNAMCRAGGVIGYFTNNTTSTLEIKNVGTGVEDSKRFDVVMYGVAEATGSAAGGFGGVIGNIVNSNPTNLVIDTAYVSLNGTFSKPDSNNNFYFGGIVGRNNCVANSSMQISKCYVVKSKFASITATENTCRITMGGIVGGVNNTLTGTYSGDSSYIRDCHVDDFKFSCDGLAGGIIGSASSGNGVNIPEISDCTVYDVDFIQNMQTNIKDMYIIIGGIAPIMRAKSNYSTIISNCSTSDISCSYLVTSSGPGYYFLGGIVGESYGNSTTNQSVIKDCTSDISYNVCFYDGVIGAAYIGGIAGYATNSTITNCASVIEKNTFQNFKNNLGEKEKSYTVSSDKNAKNLVVGGLIGVTESNVTLSDSCVGGTIDVQNISGLKSGVDNNVTEGISGSLIRENVIGGLVGSVLNSGFKADNCFNTVSLAGDLKDSIGGLIGYNNNTNTVVQDCHFGGFLINPYASSIANYSTGGTYTSVSYNPKYAPNAVTNNSTEHSLGSGVSATDTISNSKPASTNANYSSYFDAIKDNELEFSGDHVFAVNDADIEATKLTTKETTYTAASGKEQKIVRNVKLIRNLINSTQNGTSKPFEITDATDLGKMQQYVKFGGGFRGAKFKLADSVTDIESDLTLPIGMTDKIAFACDTESQPFCGEFDGNSKTITFTTNRDTQNYNGLFGFVDTSVIKNLNINFDTSITWNSSICSGCLVGFARYSNINNITVTSNNGMKLTGLVCGGIVGYSQSTAINNSRFSGEIKGQNTFGGIAGQLSNTDPEFNISAGGGTNGPLKSAVDVSYTNAIPSTVGNSYSAGNISISSQDSNDGIGGIVGTLFDSGSSVSNSFFFGNLTADSNVGGILGYINYENPGSTNVNNSVIKSCYVNGTVTAKYNSGGILGSAFKTNDNIVVNNTYFVGQIITEGKFGAMTSSSAKYQNFYYDVQVAGNIPVNESVENDTNAELTSAQLIKKSGISGFSLDSEGKHYPQLSVFKTGDNTIVSGLSTEHIYDFTDNADNMANSFKYDSEGKNTLTVNLNLLTPSSDELTAMGITNTGSIYRVSSAGKNGTIVFTTARLVNNYYLKIEEKIVVCTFTGLGTEDNQYQIRNVKELNDFRDYINNTYNGAGLFFKLTMNNDSPETATPAHSDDGNTYDLSGTDQIDSNSDNKKSISVWDEVIGKTSFQGNFDGNNKKITNFNIDKTIGSNSTSLYLGLFGNCVNATISNLTIEGKTTISCKNNNTNNTIFSTVQLQQFWKTVI